MAKKKTGLYEELTQRIPATELSTLLKVSSSLASTMELAEVLQIAIESVTDLLGIGTGAIYTLDNENLVLGATSPPLPSQFPNVLRFAQLKDHPHIKSAVETRAPVYLQDVSVAPLSPEEKAVVDSRLIQYPVGF